MVTKLLVQEGYAPKPYVSPSQLEKFAECPRQWAYHYIQGLRPEKGGEEYKRFIGSLRGTLIHACMDSYTTGKNVYEFETLLKQNTLDQVKLLTPSQQEELYSFAPQRAMPLMTLIPPLEEIELSYTEAKTDPFDSRSIRPDLPLVNLVYRKDYEYLHNGNWHVVDWKSTKSKQYMKSEDTLLKDPQGVIYGLDLIIKRQVATARCMWGYTISDPVKRPEAIPVRFDISWPEVKDVAEAMIGTASEMSQAILAHKPVEHFPQAKKLPPLQDSPCLKFGGCVYHVDAGGPCNPGTLQGQGLIQLITSSTKEKKMNEQLSLDDILKKVTESAETLAPEETAEAPKKRRARKKKVVETVSEEAPTEKKYQRAGLHLFVQSEGETLDWHVEYEDCELQQFVAMLQTKVKTLG